MARHIRPSPPRKLNWVLPGVRVHVNSGIHKGCVGTIESTPYFAKYKDDWLAMVLFDHNLRREGVFVHRLEVIDGGIVNPNQAFKFRKVIQ